MRIKFLIINIIIFTFFNSFTFAEEKSTDNFIERGFKKIFSKNKVEKKSSEKSLQKPKVKKVRTDNFIEAGVKKLFAKQSSEEPQLKGLNFYTGMFDFSDDGKRANLYGVEHQNENLYRNTIFGKISPVTGVMITKDRATYIYTGVETNYSVGALNVTPSFTPGWYRQGDGKDLGHPLEFKSEVQLSVDLSKSTNLGMSYNHVSNASLGDKNPGANSYMFNFLKRF